MKYAKTSEDKWLFSEYEGENAVLVLTSILRRNPCGIGKAQSETNEFQITLQDLYAGVDFSNLEE